MQMIQSVYVYLTHLYARQAFNRLHKYLEDIKSWMSAYKLKLNPDES